MTFEKHRLEKENYELDFGPNRLASGETISSIDSVIVTKRTATGWDDVTTEFGTLGEALDGTSKKVQFTLNIAASATVQLGGIYKIFCRATTSLGRQVATTKTLSVDDTATV